MSKKKKRRGAGYTIAIILCLCVAAFAAFRLLSILNEYHKGTAEYNEIRGYTEPLPEDGTAEAVSSSGMQAESIPACPISVDFASLQAINEDVIGWIYIGAVDISYPIVQGEDDDYYLHRTFRRQNNFAGSIFMEYRNSPDFSDPNTIIYGHNMKNGSMFGKLKRLVNDSAYQDDPYFWILTPDGNFCYRMFSLKKVAVNSDTYTLFSGADESFVEFAEKMRSESDVDTGDAEFTTDSRIVTLSTCTGDSARRFVVQGLRVSG